MSPASAPAAGRIGDWTVGRDAFAELWFHALAAVTPAEPGAIGLYSAEYVGEVAAARRVRGIVSRLDTEGPALRTALRGERELEVLHFVPMYFIGEPPDAVLRALRVALASPRPPEDDALARRAAAIARTLTSPRARAEATQIVDAAADEWRAMRQAGWAPTGPEPSVLNALRGEWLHTLEPALRPYLTGTGIRRGRIVVVPAIGLDGRVLQAPDGSALVVVGTGGTVIRESAPLLLAVRELSYPLIRRLPPRLLAAGPGARAAAEGARGAAAVRAGALLLEARAPAVAPAYRALFTGTADGADRRAFDARYATSADLVAALESEVARLPIPRAGTP